MAAARAATDFVSPALCMIGARLIYAPADSVHSIRDPTLRRLDIVASRIRGVSTRAPVGRTPSVKFTRAVDGGCV